MHKTRRRRTLTKRWPMIFSTMYLASSQRNATRRGRQGAAHTRRSRHPRRRRRRWRPRARPWVGRRHWPSLWRGHLPLKSPTRRRCRAELLVVVSGRGGETKESATDGAYWGIGRRRLRGGRVKKEGEREREGESRRVVGGLGGGVGAGRDALSLSLLVFLSLSLSRCCAPPAPARTRTLFS